MQEEGERKREERLSSQQPKAALKLGSRRLPLKLETRSRSDRMKLRSQSDRLKLGRAATIPRSRSDRLLSPIAAVQIAIAHRLGDVLLLDLRGAFQVGDSAGHLEDTAVGAGREVETLHGGVEEVGGGGV